MKQVNFIKNKNINGTIVTYSAEIKLNKEILSIKCDELSNITEGINNYHVAKEFIKDLGYTQI